MGSRDQGHMHGSRISRGSGASVHGSVASSRRSTSPSRRSRGSARYERGRGPSYKRRGGSNRGRGYIRDQSGIYNPGGPANIDSRLMDKSQDDIVLSLRSLSLKDNDIPVRPGFGTQGQAIKLRTNYFTVKVPRGPLYEYHVEITPKPRQGDLTRILDLAETTPQWERAGMAGRVAHDHASKLIAAKKLPQPLTVKVTMAHASQDETQTLQPPKPQGGKKSVKKQTVPKEYTLSLKFTAQLETRSLISYMAGQREYQGYDVLPIISALNIILAAHPSRSSGGGVVVGRNKHKFFHPSATEPPFAIGGGLEAWRGFYSSVRPVHKQLMVNVNVCTMAFYIPGNFAERMQEFVNASLGARPGDFARHVRIRMTHLGYKKTARCVADLTPKQYSFVTDKHGKVTVEQYYELEYGITLKYPDLPLLDISNSSLASTTSKGKKKEQPSYIPMELCEILEKQPYRGVLFKSHTREMTLYACRPPNINADAIVNRGLNELGYAQTANPLGVFDISVGMEMAIVPARILPSPNVLYATGSAPIDDMATWDLKGVQFVAGATLAKWAVLVIRDGLRDDFTGVGDPALRKSIKQFVDVCRNSGMKVANEPPAVASVDLPKPKKGDKLRKDAIRTIQGAMVSVRPKPSLFLVILSGVDSAVYDGVKHLCDVFLNVPTVCVLSGNFREERGQRRRFANIALKLNTKLGGINHTLDEASMQFLNAEPTMLAGMDVTHPGAKSVRGTPSIAAVVGSTNANFSQYPASMRIQEPCKELKMITDLEDMMIERLSSYKSKNGRFPSRILVYRDGVSEGQLHTICAEELPEIRRAFRKVAPGQAYKPKLTIVVCGKRHHTRFYPTEARHADKNGNPKPGTVVDRGVTAIYDYDFFLQAHAGREGTSRPTHYYVVHDEIGFSADELQMLTNNMSYMFSRATKAVSLVSPAYYADIACERGRCYLRSLLVGISNTFGTGTSGSPDADTVMEEAKDLWRNGVGDALKETMFYL